MFCFVLKMIIIKKESIFNSIEKKITLRLTFASFSTQNN